MIARQGAQLVQQRVASRQILLRLGIDQRVEQTVGQRLVHGGIVRMIALQRASSSPVTWQITPRLRNRSACSDFGHQTSRTTASSA